MKGKIIELKRWDSKYTGVIKLTCLQTEIHHAHYRCISVISEKKQIGMLWKLQGAANPSIPLLQLFQLFAIPTNQDITKQLLHFIIKSKKAYNSTSDGKKNFYKQFYSSNLGDGKRKVVKQHQKINQILSAIEKMDNQQLKKYQQLYLSGKITENKPLVQQLACELIQERVRQNLDQLVIMTQKERMNKIKTLCNALAPLGVTELLIDQQSQVYIFTQSFKIQDYSILTLHLFLELYKKNKRLTISEQSIERLICNMVSKLKKIKQSLENRQINFSLNFDSVFVQFNINKQTNQIIMDEQCQLDIMQPILKVLGLHNELCSIQTTLIFRSSPRPNIFPFSFTKILQQDFTIDQNDAKEIDLGIQLILLMDHLFTSITDRERMSIIQTQQNRKKIISNFLEHQSRNLHESTKTLINILNLSCQYQIKSILKQINLNNIGLIYQEQQQQKNKQKNFFEQNKYALVKNSVILREKLYSGYAGSESLKNFCTTNKIIKCINKQGKYIVLYILAIYAIMQTERQLLELWTGDKINMFSVKQQKDSLTYELKKFPSLIPKLQSQIEKFQKPFECEDQQIQKNVRQAIELCKTVKDRPYGINPKLELKDRQQELSKVERFVAELKKKIDFIFSAFEKDLQKEVDSQQKRMSNRDIRSYLSGLKAIRLKQIFVHLSFNNYPEAYTEQVIMAEFNPQLNKMTKQQLKQKFYNMESKVPLIIKKSSQSCQDIFTSLDIYRPSAKEK